jgi:hypothetical protein
MALLVSANMAVNTAVHPLIGLMLSGILDAIVLANA